jgi:hypothetical protein
MSIDGYRFRITTTDIPTAGEWKAHQAFHNLYDTVLQRDSAWAESARKDDEIGRLRKALTDEGFKFCREHTVCTGCDNAADCEYAQEASDD